MRHINILLILLFAYSNGNCQNVDDDSIVLRIKNKITNFFIEQGVLERSISRDTGNYVFAYEILENKILGYNKVGVYRIGVLQSHTRQHILLKEADNIKIFNLFDIDLLLRELLDFQRRNDIQIDRMLSYMSIIIKSYQSQYKN